MKVVALTGTLAFVGAAALAGADPLVELGARVDSTRIELGETTWVEPVLNDYRWSWRVGSEEDGGEARLVFRAPEGGWVLSAYDSVEIALSNPGDEPVVVRGQAANAGGLENRDRARNAISLEPGAAGTLRVRLVRRPEDPGWSRFEPFIMYFRGVNVRDNTVDPSAVDHVAIRLNRSGPNRPVIVHSVTVAGDGVPAPVPFFPFVDEYGQYVHSQWPGKVRTDEDLADRVREERRELEEWPGPGDWNEYGGWASGPQLESTGFFRVTKYAEKWWLVDPSGSLFWSYGPTGVGLGEGGTPITDREHWFATLPDEDSDLGRFYEEGTGARYRYYRDREWTGFRFAGANLFRKYGEDFREIVADLSHDRLRSWGFNTVGAWSSPAVTARRRTPYTTTLHYGGPRMNENLPDVFHADWESAVRERIERERGDTAGDRWNIGYFVDNELGWSWRPRAAGVGEVAMQHGADAASKRRFVEMLRNRYESIEAFNDAWGRDHESWEALTDATVAPDMDRDAVQADCGDFGMAYAERYFSYIGEILDDVAPDHLYLGVRFHGHIDPALVRLASGYVDVISYNIYGDSPAGRANQYRHVDVPILISEFSAGSNVVQTPFRYEGEMSPDPGRRSRLLETYLGAAFTHPLVVGAHFFQFRDQPLTGGADGEAGARGLINATDTPDFDLIRTNRRLAYDLYGTRSE